MLTNPTIQTIMDRRSTRAFKADPVPQEVIETLIECGIHAPSGRNMQPWHISVVTDPALIGEMNDGFMRHIGEEFVRENPGFLVHYGAPAVLFISGDTSNKFNETDCGMLTQNITLAAESLGFGSCIAALWCVLFENEPQYYQRLGIPEGHHMHFGIAIGYKDMQTPAKPREKKVTYVK